MESSHSHAATLTADQEAALREEGEMTLERAARIFNLGEVLTGSTLSEGQKAQFKVELKRLHRTYGRSATAVEGTGGPEFIALTDAKKLLTELIDGPLALDDSGEGADDDIYPDMDALTATVAAHRAAAAPTPESAARSPAAPRSPATPTATVDDFPTLQALVAAGSTNDIALSPGLAREIAAALAAAGMPVPANATPILARTPVRAAAAPDAEAAPSPAGDEAVGAAPGGDSPEVHALPAHAAATPVSAAARSPAPRSPATGAATDFAELRAWLAAGSPGGAVLSPGLAGQIAAALGFDPTNAVPVLDEPPVRAAHSTARTPAGDGAAEAAPDDGAGAHASPAQAASPAPAAVAASAHATPRSPAVADDSTASPAPLVAANSAASPAANAAHSVADAPADGVVAEAAHSAASTPRGDGVAVADAAPGDGAETHASLAQAASPAPAPVAASALADGAGDPAAGTGAQRHPAPARELGTSSLPVVTAEPQSLPEGDASAANETPAQVLERLRGTLPPRPNDDQRVAAKYAEEAPQYQALIAEIRSELANTTLSEATKTYKEQLIAMAEAAIAIKNAHGLFLPAHHDYDRARSLEKAARNTSAHRLAIAEKEAAKSVYEARKNAFTAIYDTKAQEFHITLPDRTRSPDTTQSNEAYKRYYSRINPAFGLSTLQYCTRIANLPRVEKLINVISARANALLQAQDPVQKEKGKKIIDAINALKIAIAEDATFDRAKIISQFANDPQILNTDAKKLEQADSLMFSQMKSVFNVVGVERYAQYDTQADFFDDRVISKKVKTQFAHVCKELAAHRNTGYLASIARFFGFNTHTTSLNEVKQQVPQL